jgi:hypothetical protein
MFIPFSPGLRLCAGAVLVALATVGASGVALAQSDAKTVVPVAASSPFQSLVNWLQGLTQPAPAPLPAHIQPLPLAAAPPASQAANFEPLPVILGEPYVALAGGAPGTGAAGWGAALNYQGMQVSLMVADKAGKKWQSRSLASGVKVGERFKLLVTPSFDAQVQLEQILGAGWVTQRGPQVFPASGAVSLPAGQSAWLPPGDQMFSVTASPNPRFVLTVRHAKATMDNRSSQPAYRRDAASASHYVQMVPAGSWPWLEQVVSTAR